MPKVIETPEKPIVETPTTSTETPKRKVLVVPEGNDVPEFGGQYSAKMKEIYRQSKDYLSLTNAQAFRLCQSFLADWGRVAKMNKEMGVGKPDKDMLVTLRELNIAEKVIMSDSIRIVKLVQELHKIRIFGVVKFGIKLTESLNAWLDDQQEPSKVSHLLVTPEKTEEDEEASESPTTA